MTLPNMRIELLGRLLRPVITSAFFSRTFVMASQNLVKEGQCEIMLPVGVFYNPVQEFNRDLTIAVIKQFEVLHRHESLLRIYKSSKDSNSCIEKKYTGLRILEALAATGIRSIRFAQEIPNVARVVANDLDPNAVSLIKENVVRNNVSNHVEVVCSDAVDLMYKHRTYSERFNVVDIDPYGTASPFLNSAMQCLHSGGLLCVTSTDMAVLCGSTPGTSMGKYGGMAIKTHAAHEVGLRILLNAIQTAASLHGKFIEPLLSLSVDFYVRVFVRVWHSPKTVKSIAAKHGICFVCPGCSAIHVQPLGQINDSSRTILPAHGPCVSSKCNECGSQFRIFGPIWIGYLHNQSFLYDFLTGLNRQPKSKPFICPSNKEDQYRTHSLILQDNKPAQTELLSISTSSDLTKPKLIGEIQNHYGTYKRIVGMVTMAYEELPDIPLYYKVDKLTSVIGCIMPTMLEFHSCFLNAGYRISCSHADKNTFKTNAPHSFVLDCLLAWNEKIKSENHLVAKSNLGNLNLKTSDLEQDENLSVRSKRRLRRKRKSSSDSDDDIHNNSDQLDNSEHQNLNQVRNVLLSRPLNSSIKFTIHPDANPSSRADGLIRYQVNPEKYWGPKPKPKMGKSPPPLNNPCIN